MLEEKETTSSENMKNNRRISTERKELSESSILPEQVLVAWGTEQSCPRREKASSLEYTKQTKQRATGLAPGPKG